MCLSGHGVPLSVGENGTSFVPSAFLRARRYRRCRPQVRPACRVRSGNAGQHQPGRCAWIGRL